MQRGPIKNSIAVITLAFASFIGGCAYINPPRERIPVEFIAAPTRLHKNSSPQRQLVVVLPGIGDTLKTMHEAGIAQAIHRTLPDADVVLVELTLPYYIHTEIAQRLHEEIVQPAKQRGYRDVYLTGASLGGMGALLYERSYPNEMRGLILMAPFMGDSKLIGEIKGAGGLHNWDPGPVPAKLNGGNAPRENWRLLKSLANQSARARDIWIVCGSEDRFAQAAELIANLLPAQNYIELPGGHAWTVWSRGALLAFESIERAPGLAFNPPAPR